MPQPPEPREPSAHSHAHAAPCPFCDLGDRPLVAENSLAVAFLDGFPVSPGHTLIIPRRHVATWFEATKEEQLALLELADRVKAALDAAGAADPLLERQTPTAERPTVSRPDGYNLGLNCGEAAGQTVPHLHLHLIPRYLGDVDDPTGGVRFVIPDKGNYRRGGFIPRSPAASPRRERSGAESAP